MDRLTAILQKDDPLLRPLRWQGQNFPGIWAAMMPQGLLEMHSPAERQSTCGRCPKACHAGYRADYRCCTYHPLVANFLLGLATETESGANAVRSLLDSSMLLPEGMQASPAQWVDFQKDQAEDLYGRSTRVLCPLLNRESGLCSIYAFRNSVCSTFFCESDHGGIGREFWLQVQTLGSQVEMALRQWALREIGFDLDAYFKALSALAPVIGGASKDKGWSDEALRALWGDWRGREIELLRETAAAVVSRRDDLWAIAQGVVTRQSLAFETALDALAPMEENPNLDDEGSDHEGSDDEGSDHEGSDHEGSDHEGSDHEGSDHEGSDENDFSPASTWASCLEVHGYLWSQPDGAFRLSPNAAFVGNNLKTAEEIYHQDKEFFLEYSFGQALQWRLAISSDERRVLRLFEEQAQTLAGANAEAVNYLGSRARIFLQEMLNRKVLWPCGPQRTEV